MKKLFKFMTLALVSVFSLFTMSSCKSDELTTFRITGEWETISMTIEGEPMDITEATKFTRFDADGSYWTIYSEGDPYTKEGTWTINDRVLTMIPDSDYSMSVNYKIEGILAGIMVLQTEAIDITITLKRVQDE